MIHDLTHIKDFAARLPDLAESSVELAKELDLLHAKIFHVQVDLRATNAEVWFARHPTTTTTTTIITALTDLGLD